MSKPNLGLLLPNQGVVFGAVTVKELVELAEEADETGHFDALFVGDNLYTRPRMESVTLLSAIAVRTKTARLGTACMASFPVRDPLVLAAQWASLDNLSDGRSLLVACIGGSGGATSALGQFKREYDAFRIPTKERVGRLTEGIEVLRTLWSEDPASHQGKYFNFEGLAVRPAPVKKPCPPIWIANNPYAFGEESETYRRATERVGRVADGWMTTRSNPEEFRKGWEAVRRAATAHGRDPDTLESCLYYNAHIGEPEAAYEETKRFLDEYYTSNFSPEMVENWAAFGPAEVVAEKLHGFAAAGAQVISVRFTAYDQTTQLRRFVKEVVPLL